MKKIFIIFLALFCIAVVANFVWADCATIQDGTITASTGEVLTTGYDDFGYNYQANIFNGRYCDYDRVLGGDDCDVELIMKWNNPWLSNVDCDGDGKLDRHFGYNSYIGSGAWCTNHMSGRVEVDGKSRKWTYFVKIVAVGENDHAENGYWYTPEGIEIGPVIWGSFAIIEEVSNDPSMGEHGILYKSPACPGLGAYGPE